MPPSPRGKAVPQLRRSTGRSRLRSELDHRTCPKASRGGLTQPLPVPDPLRTAARPTRPLEPILFPKLRIQFADFPYLHYCYQLEAVHLGDLLRIWVRTGEKITPSPQDFQGPTAVQRTPREARCFTVATSLSRAQPIPGSWLLTKKRELFPRLPPTSPGSFALPRVAPKRQSPQPGTGILTRFPFDRCG